MEHKNFSEKLNNLEKEIANAIYDLLDESGHNTNEGLTLLNTTNVHSQNLFEWYENCVIDVEASCVRAVKVDNGVIIEVIDDHSDPTDDDEWCRIINIDSLNDLYEGVWDTLTIDE